MLKYAEIRALALCLAEALKAPDFAIRVERFDDAATENVDFLIGYVVGELEGMGECSLARQFYDLAHKHADAYLPDVTPSLNIEPAEKIEAPQEKKIGRVMIGVRIAPDAKQTLKHYASKHGLSEGRVVEEAVRRLAASTLNGSTNQGAST